MLTDQELQSLRNMGNEAEAAADEIVMLRARVVELAALVPIAETAERERWRTAARLVLEATPEQMPLALDALRDVLGA